LTGANKKSRGNGPAASIKLTEFRQSAALVVVLFSEVDFVSEVDLVDDSPEADEPLEPPLDEEVDEAAPLDEEASPDDDESDFAPLPARA
jgi:hypothetical protein